MRKQILSAAILAAVLALPHAAFAQSPLQDASRAIDAKHYDTAIAIVESYIVANPNSAPAEVLLARAFHWEKDFANAKVHYRRAAAIDTRYRLEIVPLLDELGESAEIVRICGPEIGNGTTASPSTLGSLATAYRNLGKAADAERVRNILTNTAYTDPGDVDYKNYELAEFALWDGDTRQAKDHLRAIKDQGYRQYARTDDKFKVLFNDSEFLELTK
jgi:tetratricopeptide (TPR) repeat protein